jgi:hypothetical protein
LVANDKTQNPINFLYIPKWLPLCQRKMQLSKKGEKCQLDPNRDSFVGGFGGRRACASLEQVSSDVTKKLKCSRWEEFAGQIPALGHTTRSWQQTREKWNELVLLNCLLW